MRRDGTPLIPAPALIPASALIPVLALLPALLLAPGCSRRTESPALPTLVKALPAAAAGPELELRGSVASEGRLRLGFKAPGILGALKVREGDAVRQGQLLAVLDEADAQAQVLAARASLERARREAERAERLVREGALPAAQWDDARNALEGCQAQWALAQEALRRTRILAPASGTLFQRLAEPGEAVQAGAPVLVLDTTGRLVVRAGVTEAQLRRLRPGQPALLLPEDGGAPQAGRVRSLGAAPTQEDGLYPLEILPDGPLALRPGALLKVRLEAAPTRDLVIPATALVHRQDQDVVFVVEGAPGGVRVRMRPVRVERAEGQGLQVRQGLEAGERVVSEGAFFLQDGQAVRIQE